MPASSRAPERDAGTSRKASSICPGPGIRARGEAKALPGREASALPTEAALTSLCARIDSFRVKTTGQHDAVLTPTAAKAASASAGGAPNPGGRTAPMILPSKPACCMAKASPGPNTRTARRPVPPQKASSGTAPKLRAVITRESPDQPPSRARRMTRVLSKDNLAPDPARMPPAAAWNTDWPWSPPESARTMPAASRGRAAARASGSSTPYPKEKQLLATTSALMTRCIQMFAFQNQ